MYLPITLDVGNKRCVVVGGGRIATRKIEFLITTDAEIVVISPYVTDAVAAMVQDGKVTHKDRIYRTGDLEGAVMAIAATSDPDVNKAVHAEATDLGVLINVVDSQELCSFMVPATVRRGDLTISVSTNGKSPAVARRVREKIEDTIGPEYEPYLKMMDELRSTVRAEGRDNHSAHKAYKLFLDSNILELIREGDMAQAEERMRSCMS